VRTVVLALLAAFAVPLLVKGVLQVLVDHPETIAAVRAHEAGRVRIERVAPDSPAALAYERRLMQARRLRLVRALECLRVVHGRDRSRGCSRRARRR
jgi:hypothetical protein